MSHGRSFGYNSSTGISSSLRMSSAGNNGSSIAPGTEWEDLRKQARQHENEIDAKLMSFSKLCSNYVARDYHSIDGGATSSSVTSFETMSLEIEKLLERLSEINKRMSDAVPALLGPNSAATHTLQRHHEILQDYRREFERTKANIRAFKSREDILLGNSSSSSASSSVISPLLGSSSGGSVQEPPGGLSSRRQDYYLREMDRLTSSNKLMDTNLELANRVQYDLAEQRKHLSSVSMKIQSFANRFPLVNNVLQKIKVKKRKDSLVLGCVIAVCLIILLLYIFR